MLHRNESLNHSTSWGALASLCESESHSVMSKLFFFFSCPTLCDPMDYTVHGIFQARILEWVAFPFSRGWLRRNVKCLWKEKCRDNQLQSCDQFFKWGLLYICIFPILFSPWVVSDSLQPRGWQHTRLPCPPLSPGICSDSCVLSPWCYLILTSSDAPSPFCLQSFPALGKYFLTFDIYLYYL